MSKLRYNDEWKPDPWRDMATAPKNGKTKVQLRLKDGYGEFQFKVPCIWLKGKWVNSRTLTAIAATPIGWQPVRRYGGYDE